MPTEAPADRHALEVTQQRRERARRIEERRGHARLEAELVGQRFACRGKAKAHRINAVALTRRRWPVVEHVPLVRAAAGADDFCPAHPVTGVTDVPEVPFSERLGEARPACPTLELRAAVKERQPA